MKLCMFLLSLKKVKLRGRVSIYQANVNLGPEIRDGSEHSYPGHIAKPVNVL